MKQEVKIHLLPIEIITLVYIALTTALIGCFYSDMQAPNRLLSGRMLIVLVMAVLYGIHQYHPCKMTRFLRIFFPATLLGYWYPDTYEFCQLFSNLDHVFAAADLALFGCQPAIVFSQLLPQKLWSELFNMGYFSYYLLIAVTMLEPLTRSFKLFERTTFIVMCAFFCYYFIYLFLPVAGPQYYFQAVGFDIIQSGHFPQIGDYFRYQSELAPSPGVSGFFRDLVDATQSSGERPTAAFPSSHVGMSTVLMFLLYRGRKYLFYFALPFYVLLCGATVYIQAHYLIDVIGGLVSAVVFYYLSIQIWEIFERHDPSLLVEESADDI